jgi:hypothetical protein
MGAPRVDAQGQPEAKTLSLALLLDGPEVGDIDFDTTIDCRNGAGEPSPSD